jgi:hypothetical protein
MNLVTLREFLSSGTIGSVKLGMLPQMVEQFWGPPDDRSVQRHPTEILRYGSLELVFKTVPDTDDTRLISIAIYFAKPKQQCPVGAKFEDFSLGSATTEAEFRKFIADAGLQVHSKVVGQYTHLVLDSGASAVFDEGRLHSVRYRRADKLPRRRQMSLSLPESTLSELRARAENEKISLQQLIERELSRTR